VPEREKADLLHAGNLLISALVCDRLARRAVRWDAELTTICIRNLRKEAIHAT